MFIVTVPVTVTEAALGAKIDVPTVDTHDGGPKTQLKIPPGTQTGQKLRLREKGVPSRDAGTAIRGDQIVEVKIVVPQVRDERSKEILRELAALNPDDPRSGTFLALCNFPTVAHYVTKKTQIVHLVFAHKRCAT